MALSPPAIASLISGNLVPVAGVLFLGWSAANLLLLYYLDTILEFAVVVLLIARHITGMGKPDEPGRPMNGPGDWLRTGLGALLGALLMPTVAHAGTKQGTKKTKRQAAPAAAPA